LGALASAPNGFLVWWIFQASTLIWCFLKFEERRYLSILELYESRSLLAFDSKLDRSEDEVFFHILPSAFPISPTEAPGLFFITEGRVLLAQRKNADIGRLGAFMSVGFFDDLPNVDSISITSSISTSSFTMVDQVS